MSVTLFIGAICLVIVVLLLFVLFARRDFANWLVARKFDGAVAVAAASLLAIGVVGVIVGLTDGSTLAVN